MHARTNQAEKIFCDKPTASFFITAGNVAINPLNKTDLRNNNKKKTKRHLVRDTHCVKHPFIIV